MTLRGGVLLGVFLGFVGGVFALLQLGDRYGLWPLLAISVAAGLVGGALQVGRRWVPQGPTGRGMRALLVWLRGPLDHGPAWTTWVTLATVTVVPTIILLVPVADVTRITALGFTVAGFGLLLGLTRPRFFWHNGIVEGWREFFGDRSVVIIYVGLASTMILALLAATLL